MTNNCTLKAWLAIAVFFMGILSGYAQCDPDTASPLVACTDIVEIAIGLPPDTINPMQFVEAAFDNCDESVSLRFAWDGQPLDGELILDCSDIGPHIILTTATDSSGNESMCWTEVTVNDKIFPYVFCSPLADVPLDVYLAPGGPLLFPTDSIIAGMVDNCPLDNIRLSYELAFQDGSLFSAADSLLLDCSLLNVSEIAVSVFDPVSDSSVVCSRAVNVMDTAGICTAVTLTGTLFQDSLSNCSLDPEEKGLGPYEIAVRQLPSGLSRLVRTDTLGNYTVTMAFNTNSSDNGFQLSPLGWPDYALSCGTSYELLAPPGADTVIGNIPLQIIDDCPFLTVDVGASFFRKCNENTLAVSYCNQSLLKIEGAYVEVTLDELMAFVGSSIPLSGTIDNTYTFELGDIPPLACGSFTIGVTDLCNTTLGQTLCVEAHIFPDEVCLPQAVDNWPGASITIEEGCVDDQVVFTIRNQGEAPTSQPLRYFIVEDLVMYMESDFELGPGEEVAIPLPANGSTWRVEAEQEPGHPGLYQPVAWLEGCGGINNTGLVNAFPINNNDPFQAVFCDEVIAPLDPNDKHGFPRGAGNAHLVSANQDIEYRIRFQNTGTDTAFQVVIVDTLSSLLALASFRPGASSHPYKVEIAEEGILQFVFNDIMLPDSNTNEPASHGFVKFKIAQQLDLPPGTVLDNQAAIYFDAEAPVMTNISWHTIEEPAVSANLHPSVEPGIQVVAYPNPFKQSIQFEIKGKAGREGMIRLYGPQGHLLRTAPFDTANFTLQRGSLPNGMYIYELKLRAGMVAYGKVIVMD